MSKKNHALRQVDTAFFNYWQALYMAFYSRRLFVDVGKRWRGWGILYMFLLITIASTPASIRIILDFRQYFDEQMIAPLEQLPPLYVQNGQVVFDKPMPYLIKNKEGDVVALIDTTGKVTGMSLKYPKLAILITKETLHFRTPPFQLFFKGSTPAAEPSVFTQSFDKDTNGVFVGKEWVVSSGVLKLKYLAEFLIYPVLAVFWTSTYAFFMIALAYIAQLFSIIVFKYKLPFKEACRVFLVASTAQVFLYFTLLAVKITLFGGSFIYMVILAVYFNYALISIKRESHKMVRV